MDFDFRSRERALRKFGEKKFDILVVGGGITGAAVARDAVSRGLKVAVIEKSDFAWGTSSRSSKLIHGGLRYLENFEFALVFEALAERSFFLKTMPHMVQPIEFYFPVYQNDRVGKFKLSLGLWLYDLLSVFRTPGFHKNLSIRQMIEKIPDLESAGLRGGFKYFDATMWDDLMTIETLRSAHHQGAEIANYVEAISPIWKEDRIQGFLVRDCEEGSSNREVELHAKQVVICVGPWTDLMGKKLSVGWDPWLKPSTGIHLIFDQERLSVPGAMVMSHPEDGRISFIIPRKNFGKGMVIVGTTDAPSPSDPDQARIQKKDIQYLLDLLNQYFPKKNLTREDIVAAYIGVRPLYAAEDKKMGGLKSVSREHHIGVGPGGVTMVAGGKYTTHRTMAQEIVDFTLKNWKRDARKGKADPLPPGIGYSNTKNPINMRITAPAVEECLAECDRRGWKIPESLLVHYGAEVLDLFEMDKTSGASIDLESKSDPEGFPLLESQLRFAIRKQMVIHLKDFYFRRVPLYLSRKDHGAPWAERLAQIWGEEKGRGPDEVKNEIRMVCEEIQNRDHWKIN